MTSLLKTRPALVAAFVGINLSIVLAVWVCLVAPVVARYSDRTDLIHDREAELDRLTSVENRTNAASALSGNPLLAASDERLASAELQAILQRKVKDVGGRFLSVQGVAPTRGSSSRMIGVKLSIEGQPETVRALLHEIEAGAPLMFVTSAVLRNIAETPVSPDLLHADLVVQAAMKQPTSSAIGLRRDLSLASMRDAAR